MIFCAILIFNLTITLINVRILVSALQGMFPPAKATIESTETNICKIVYETGSRIFVDEIQSKPTSLEHYYESFFVKLQH